MANDNNDNKDQFNNGEEFHDEESAYEYVERHVWPDGPVCPHCGATDRIGRLRGQSTRIHTYKCYHCRKPFTVKIGTMFEDSNVPMHKWLQAMVLSRAGKRSISANQVSKAIGVTFKTAVAMLRRIRDAANRSKVLLIGTLIVALTQLFSIGVYETTGAHCAQHHKRVKQGDAISLKLAQSQGLSGGRCCGAA